jgi:putative MATE family efflux protein
VRAQLRSPYDREILGLAVLALGSLAAEPLYVLVDTAIVGHLGRAQLAALALASTELALFFTVFNFLAYATTAQVTRAYGAGQRETAHSLGVQAVWLSLAIGVVSAVVAAATAEPAMSLLGADGRTADFGVTYLRIASLGLPFAFLALGGQGYLRGISDLRTPLVVIGVGNAVNAVLEVLFVYGFDWGIAGSAWGTTLAQALMGAGFIWRIARADGVGRRPRAQLMRRLLSIGKHIFVRTCALYASFLIATAVAARFGDASVGAHNIAFQLWVFLALVLDAIAIAGQVIAGRLLGAGDRDAAYAAGFRMIVLSTVAGAVFAVAMIALGGVLPHVFTGDHDVLEKASTIWPIFALMQPLNGAVFALDGILIGAGDARFLMISMAGASAVSVTLSLLVLALGWGIVGVWLSILTLIVLRLTLLGRRFASGRWLVTGWA